MSVVGIKCPCKELLSRKLVYARHAINKISMLRMRTAREMNEQSFVYFFFFMVSKASLTDQW